MKFTIIIAILFSDIIVDFTLGNFGSWMTLGFHGSQIFPSEAFLLGTTLPLCKQISGLSAGQQKLCMLYTDHMMHVGRGARKGITECQYQFRFKKWNCSTVDDSTVFGPILSVPSREAAFANAIASAGVVHSISRGCRDGQLDSCECSSADRPVNLKREWIWGGCGDNVHYGYKFAKNFIDIRERESNEQIGGDIQGRQLMNIHNNEAGRRAVVKSMKVTCKCHGVSGSCSLVTCWQQLSPFRDVGDILHEKYKTAMKVKVTKRGRLKIRSDSSKIPTANDLVYLQPSPDYCTTNISTGSFGTNGRQCKPKMSGAESCEEMCCGRGYDFVSTTIKERCNCKFHWCCSVECKTCAKKVQLTICK